jgi:opacity protein-like surface antigen
MKSVLNVAVLTSLLASFSAFAHHPAEDIVAEDIYLMIDENVADTPHADLDFSTMGR